jgi:hypothetical protein
MELTLGGLIGYLDGLLRSMEGTEAERKEFASNVSVMRRAILGFDVLMCAGLGYWLGTMFLGPAIGAE